MADPTASKSSRLDLSCIMSAQADGTVRVWQADEKEEYHCARVLAGHSGCVLNVDTDGKHAITASLDKTMKMWDVRSTQCIATFDNQKRSVRCVAMHGEQVVSAGAEKTIRVWDMKTGSLIRELKKGGMFKKGGHTAEITTLRFLDHATVLSGSKDGSLQVWNTESGECQQIFKKGAIGSIATMTVKYGKIFTGSTDCRIQIWDLEKGEAEKILEGHKGSVWCLDVDGDHLVTGSDDQTVCVWNWKTKTPTRRALRGHKNLVYAVLVRGDRAVSGGWDETLRVWDLNTFTNVSVLNTHSWIYHLATHPDLSKTTHRNSLKSSSMQSISEHKTGSVASAANTQATLSSSAKLKRKGSKASHSSTPPTSPLVTATASPSISPREHSKRASSSGTNIKRSESGSHDTSVKRASSSASHSKIKRSESSGSHSSHHRNDSMEVPMDSKESFQKYINDLRRNSVKAEEILHSSLREQVEGNLASLSDLSQSLPVIQSETLPKRPHHKHSHTSLSEPAAHHKNSKSKTDSETKTSSKDQLLEALDRSPEAFICPITQQVMQEPVVASDGHTYERSAIEKWLKSNNSSPMTGAKLKDKGLIPNFLIRSQIQDYLQKLTPHT